MRKELQEELFAIAPKWFDRTDITRSLMCFGFEVGNGWFTLLKTLLLTIKEHDFKGKHFEVMQVKDKYGGLRCYVDDELDPEIDGMIRLAENLSYSICEECGESGKPNKEGWTRTLCVDCREPKGN
ncbi:MAG: hypothetical protein ACREIQ_05175 [Nitrospiria bacterium]